MKFDIDSRPSDSPLVEALWRSHSSEGGSFISTAASHWEMVVTKQRGKIIMSVRGPETLASPAPVPEEAEFFGIIFKHGVYLPSLPKQELVNHEIHIPGSSKNSFQFINGSWEFPTFENADTFVNRLIHSGLLTHDSVVDDTLLGQAQNLSLRSLQRRFLYVTGMTYKTIQQIERARQALALLQSGVPIPETAYQTGYFDQPHLTRSLKLFAGQTPAEILTSSQSE